MKISNNNINLNVSYKELKVLHAAFSTFQDTSLYPEVWSGLMEKLYNNVYIIENGGNN